MLVIPVNTRWWSHAGLIQGRHKLITVQKLQTMGQHQILKTSSTKAEQHSNTIPSRHKMPNRCRSGTGPMSWTVDQRQTSTDPSKLHTYVKGKHLLRYGRDKVYGLNIMPCTFKYSMSKQDFFSNVDLNVQQQIH